MKSLSFLVFLFLATPGSGQLAWDGLPFSTRAEFVSLVLFVVVLFSREIRSSFFAIVDGFRWRSLLAPVFVVLCVTKLFTFALSPLSSGFGACYRSTYEPLKDVAACEKSYEAPFIQGHGLPAARVSRVDPIVDFGKQAYDWRLPFMNEFHRFQRVWLSRFPFTASYNFRIEHASGERKYLPLYAIGELTVSINGQPIMREENYDRHFLTVVPLPQDESKLTVDYRYADVYTSTLPDDAPAARGPYAQLKIGEPQSSTELLSRARILILGRAASGLTTKPLSRLIIYDRSGHLVNFEHRVKIQDDDDPSTALWREFDFELVIQDDALSMGPLRLVELADGKPVTLAAIEPDQENPFRVKVYEPLDTKYDVTAVLTTDRDLLVAFRPGPMSAVPILLRLLLWTLDLISMAITVFCLFVLARILRLDVVKSLLLATATWIAIYPFYKLLPSILGGGRELVLPYLLVAPLIVVSRRSVSRAPLAVSGPVAVVLAVQKVFDHLYFNHPGEGDDWWGKLVFMWRDSDWYVNHGNARLVFVDSFLRGGESVFYARTGPRYLIFAGQFLLGENDILIGLIAMTAGFLALFFLVSQFAITHESVLGHATATTIAFIGMIFLGDQIITAFGFLVTSEYTTWVGLLGVTCFLIKQVSERRIWVSTSVAAVTSLLIHFRPNIVFVCLALIALVLLRIDRRGGMSTTRQFFWAITVFLTILPISLIHNLFYGGRFVPFTENAAQTVARHKRFYWSGIWSELGLHGAVELIWEQTRILMYWTPPNDPNLAIIFWGSQMLLIAALALRLRTGCLLQPRSLVSLLPLTYVAPMVSYDLSSYYPRHIVTASLLCLCSAVVIWPTSFQQPDGPQTNSSLRTRAVLPH